jgi:hypothetical protein
MENFAKKYLVALIGVGLLAFCVSSRADQAFRFNFELNHPLVYSVESKVKTFMDRTGQVQGRSQNSLTKTTIEEHYKIKLTPLKKSKDGTWTVRYEPLDFNQDKDVLGASGHLVTSLHGLEMKGTQNGIVVIDTAKDIGEIQAKALKREIYPEMLSGYMDFNPDGQISKVDGDLPFIDYWTHKLKLRVGFFDITFSDHAVASGVAWTKNLILKDLDGMKLGDGGLVETNIYTRELIPVSTNNSIVSIDCSVASNWKDIMGSIEQLGQSTTLNISELNHNNSGKIQFNSARGCILNISSEGKIHISADLLIQGNSVSTTVDIQDDTKYELLSGQP